MNPDLATIIANGEKQILKLPCSVANFLAAHGWKPTQVVIEYNGKVLERDCLENTELRDGDHLEIIIPVAGG